MKKRSPCAEPAARARWWRTFPVVCALLVAHPAQVSGDAGANRLFVEAAKLIQVAEEEAVATRKLELLKDAKRKLEAIVDRHPSSRLAVELVSGQKIGTISLPGLVDAIEDAAVLACPQAPNPACLLFLAVATAGKIEDAGDRIQAFSYIGTARAENGNVKKAREIFAIALVTTEKIESLLFRDIALGKIASAQANAGFFEEALVTTEKIEDTDERNWTLVRIASAQGIFEEASAIAEKIEDADDRTWAFAVLADDQAKAGYIEEALATADRTEDAVSRSWALAYIAAAQAQNGNIKKAGEILAIALATAEKIEDARTRTSALAEIAVAKVRAGYIEGTFTTAETIDAGYRSSMLVELAATRAKVGDIKDAFATANSIQHTGTRAEAFARIAVAVVDAT